MAKIIATKIFGKPHSLFIPFASLDAYVHRYNLYDNYSYILSYGNSYADSVSMKISLWNIAKGLRKYSCTTFFRLNEHYRIDSKGRKSGLIFADKLNSKRSLYDTYHINDISLKILLNREYSWGNFYNSNIKFFFRYPRKIIKFNRKVFQELNGFSKRKYTGTVLNKVLLRNWRKAYYSNRLIYKLTHLEFLKKLEIALNEVNNYIFSSSLNESLSREISNLSNEEKVVFPSKLLQYKPFTYRGYKFGRHRQKDMLREVTYTGYWAFRLNRILWKGSYIDQTLTYNIFTNTQYSKQINAVVEKSKISLDSYETWYTSVTDKYNYAGFNRNLAITCYNRRYKALSTKDLLSYIQPFENEFYVSKTYSNSMKDSVFEKIFIKNIIRYGKKKILSKIQDFIKNSTVRRRINYSYLKKWGRTY